MERLRIELSGKSLDLFSADPQSARSEGLPNGEVFKVSPAHPN
jgi:hypothetical protein